MATTETLGPIAGSATYQAVAPVSPDAGFESRWAAWVERGRTHDRRLRLRLSSAALLAGLVLAAAIIYALVR